MDWNRAQVAKMLGYDVKYFTKETLELAQEEARKKKTKIRLLGNKKADDFFETDPQD